MGCRRLVPSCALCSCGTAVGSQSRVDDALSAGIIVPRGEGGKEEADGD